MATYTSNYGWAKPSGSDNVDISVLNNNLDDQDSTIHDAFLNMAPPFSESSTYAVDDIVLYGTGLYKCHTAVVTPGSWTGTTNWQVYKLSEGGSGGGTSDYTDLTNKPQINGVTLTGNKSTSDLGIDKSAVGLSNVPNVATDDQTPTFTTAQSRNNLVSGEKISVMLGKISKFFNDLKTVAFTGSYTDLSNKPQINSVELSGNKTSANLSLQNASTEITWAQWIQKTPQEQESGDWRITDCPWADGNVSVDLMTKLWENPSPTSDFAAQTIILSSADYDMLLIVAKRSVAVNNTISTIALKDKPTILSDVTTTATSGNSPYVSTRNITVTDATHLAFGDCNTGVGTNAHTTQNTRIIPIAIYGIKTTASVKINAIAMDVKASVEYSTSEHLIGKWIDGSDLYEKTIDFGALPNATTKNVSSGLSNVTIRNVECIANRPQLAFNLPWCTNSGNSNINVYYSYTTNEIVMRDWDDYSAMSAYVTLRYTQNS